MPRESLMVSWLEKLRQGLAEQSERASDPWRRVLERALPADVTAVSTVALCNLLGIRPTTGNARRIARTMRAIGIFPRQVAKAPARRLARHRRPRLGASYSTAKATSK